MYHVAMDVTWMCNVPSMPTVASPSPSRLTSSACPLRYPRDCPRGCPRGCHLPLPRMNWPLVCSTAVYSRLIRITVPTYLPTYLPILRTYRTPERTLVSSRVHHYTALVCIVETMAASACMHAKGLSFGGPPRVARQRDGIVS